VINIKIQKVLVSFILSFFSTISIISTVYGYIGGLQRDLEGAAPDFREAVFGSIDSGFYSIMYILNTIIEIVFPAAFVLLFFYTFLNAPLKKRRGTGINALCTLVGVFIVWSLMPLMATIVSGSAGNDVTSLLHSWIKYVGILIPIAAAMSTILGIALALASSPFQKYRGAGLGIVGFSILLWAVWIISPLLVSTL